MGAISPDTNPLGSASKEFRYQIAELWRQVLRTNPDVLFGDLTSRLLTRHNEDRIPQPGYVGEDYRSGGLLFISMNPGGGPKGGLDVNDDKQYRILEQLRDANDAVLIEAFAALTTALSEIMPRWKMHRNFVQPVLDGIGLDFASVGYLNLLKWRTQSSSGLASLYETSWKDHVKAQIELLSPACVIAVGSDAGRWFDRHRRQWLQYLDMIPRIIGNNIGREGRNAIERIVHNVPLNLHIA